MTYEEALVKQIEILREHFLIDKYPKRVERVCQECCGAMMHFCDRNNFDFVDITLEKLGMKEPTHFSSLVGFNTKNGVKWYLVDPTYGQFFENKEFKEYMFNNYKEFSDYILDKGYIECNLENMLAYANGFIQTNSIDAIQVYKGLQDLLVSNNVITKEVFNNKLRKIELLGLKQELLVNSKTVGNLEEKHHK